MSLPLKMMVLVAAARAVMPKLPVHLMKDREPLRQLPEVSSKNGVLEVTLVVDLVYCYQYSPEDNKYLRWKARAYNGQFPGITLRVWPGDYIVMNVTNNLEDVQDIGIVITNHDLNYTNMHTH